MRFECDVFMFPSWLEKLLKIITLWILYFRSYEFGVLHQMQSGNLDRLNRYLEMMLKFSWLMEKWVSYNPILAYLLNETHVKFLLKVSLHRFWQYHQKGSCLPTLMFLMEWMIWSRWATWMNLQFFTICNCDILVILFM